MTLLKKRVKKTNMTKEMREVSQTVAVNKEAKKELERLLNIQKTFLVKTLD